MPELRHPKSNGLIQLYWNENKSVYPFIEYRNTPVQNPIHMEHLKNFLFGLILSKICPYTKICVRPYEHNIKYIKLIYPTSVLNLVLELNFVVESIFLLFYF